MHEKNVEMAWCPRKSRTVLLLLLALLVGLVTLQCLIVWFYSARQVELKQNRIDTLQIDYTKIKSSKPVQNCSIPKFREESEVDHKVECRRKDPSPASCKKAKMFYDNRETVHCGPYQEICTLKFNWKPRLLCHTEVCKGRDVLLGTFSPESGELIWNEFPSLESMADRFQQLVLKRDPSIEAGMAFIQCRFNSTKMATNDASPASSHPLPWYEDAFMYSRIDDEIYRQLLIFPNITRFVGSFSNEEPKLNINILFLDSISHSHFFRVMPQTVKKLKDMDNNPNFDIFNFDLLQTIKGRTFECQQAFFSGRIQGKEEILKTARLFGKFKKLGYDILWNEDLCWQWYWGLARNLGFWSEMRSIKHRWEAFREEMSKSKIDDIGASLSSCEILNHNGKKDPFDGLDQVCYNGRHQHWYILEYVKQLQTLYDRANRPYFQFTELNVGHDDHGLRIKTLDEDLTSYLEHLSLLRNTLTIIFSDHGNVYSQYAYQTEEGRIEMYHPTMFFITPRNFAKFVGPSGINGLSMNQHRLVTLLDVHYTLMYFANETYSPSSKQSISDYDIQPRGLLDAVSPYRTCLSLPLYPNTKCICHAQSMNTTYTSSHLLLADFALGTLNNMIQSQYHGTMLRRTSAFGACQKLQVTTINEAKESRGRHNTTQLEMTVLTNPGHPFQDKEAFSFTISVRWHQNSTFNLTGFERLSRFNKYEKCADSGVNNRLCVCNVNVSSGVTTAINASSYPSVLGQNSKFHRVSACLVVFERRRLAGLVLDGLNQCKNTTLEVEINGVTKNVISSSKLPARFTLLESQNIFLVAFLGIDKTDNWAVRYSVNVTSSK